MDIKHVQDDETNGIFIASSETGSRIGYLIWDFPDEKRNVIEICDLLIHDEKDRGKGIGSKLINSLLEHAHTLDVDKIIGVTQADDPLAHAFYEKHGFHFPTPDKLILPLGKR